MLNKDVESATNEHTNSKDNKIVEHRKHRVTFDKSASGNVTTLLGRTAYLNCRVKIFNSVHRSVSFPFDYSAHIYLAYYFRDSLFFLVFLFSGCEPKPMWNGGRTFFLCKVDAHTFRASACACEMYHAQHSHQQLPHCVCLLVPHLLSAVKQRQCKELFFENLLLSVSITPCLNMMVIGVTKIAS